MVITAQSPTHRVFAVSTCCLLMLVVASAALGQQPPDLSIPMFAPRPLVWRQDWKPTELETSAVRESARMQMRIADQLKSQEEFKSAEQNYQRAMRMDPTWAYPAYQLACNYELSGQHEKAIPFFERAMKLGFADFPTAISDDELGKIRNAPDFKQTLSKIRERYVAKSESRIGTPVAVKPNRDKPAAGYPMILLLHGYGDSNENYVELAEAWAKLGFVAVAVPGTVPSRVGGFTWAMESTEPTLRDVRAIISSQSMENLIDKDKVFMLGFSQGALHAILLAAQLPDEFAGVVALSPGGSLSQQLVLPKISRGGPCKLVFLHGTEEPHAPIAARWRQACAAAGWAFMTKTHEGGHHFPANWERLRLSISRFLLQ